MLDTVSAWEALLGESRHWVLGLNNTTVQSSAAAYSYVTLGIALFIYPTAELTDPSHNTDTNFKGKDAFTSALLHTESLWWELLILFLKTSNTLWETKDMFWACIK